MHVHFPSRNGFHGDTSATFYIGEPTPLAKHVVEVSRHCLELGYKWFARVRLWATSDGRFNNMQRSKGAVSFVITLVMGLVASSTGHPPFLTTAVPEPGPDFDAE